MNTGFFTSKQTQSESRPDGKVYSCASCGLSKHAESPKMNPFGNFKKGILNIGEAPGKTEDHRGKQWQGKTGQFLQRTYSKLGIDLFEDCLNINAVNCRPVEKGNNRTPTANEIASCRKSVLDVIKEYQPKLIVVLGNAALTSLIGHRWKKDLGGIMKWRGWTIPDQDYKAWICPVFHPSFVDREDKEEVHKVWELDLEAALKKGDEKFLRHRTPQIEVIEDLTVLKNISTDMITFDYETTGLKPHAAGHRVVSCAIADTANHCYAFMMPGTKRGRQPLIDLLLNPYISKMAHNIKFEEEWSVVRLKHSVINWMWDSMLAAHVLDNRSGVTSLKFQAYVQFGVVDYSSKIEPYLRSKKEDGANAVNQIDTLLKLPGGKEKLLTYNGLDSIYEYRLALKQQKEMNFNYLPF